MRRTALIISLVMAVPGLAVADEPNPKTAASPELTKLLDSLRTSSDAATRLAAAKKLTELEPLPLDALRKHLRRSRSSTDKDRRKVLRSIRADVPDHKGKFRTPRRKKKRKVTESDKFDWLAKLVKLPASTPGLSDVIVDVSIIRAIAGAKTAAAGYALLDHSFTGDGLIFRDECGRYLRKMAPYSIPALIEGAGQRRNYHFRRYSIYQLERLDRQNSEKAVNAASSDTELLLALFRAFGEVRYRDAVRVVWANVNHHVPVVRAGARKAWLRYVTGKPPRPAPKRKLQKTGGEKTNKEKKLWLNSRELARVLLEEHYEEALKKEARRSMSEGDLTEALFAHFDAERKKRSDGLFQDAKNKIANGDYGAATGVFDRLLAANAEHPRRAEMAPAFLAYAKALAHEGKWKLAAASFRKASALDPAAVESKTALAWHHYALGRALTAAGADGKPELRRALAIDPGFSEAKAALAGRAPAVGSKGNGAKGETDKRSWLLYAGIGGGGIAVLLLAIGLFLRRR